MSARCVLQSISSPSTFRFREAGAGGSHRGAHCATTGRRPIFSSRPDIRKNAALAKVSAACMAIHTQQELQIARSFAWTIIVGKSAAMVCISCQHRLELYFTPSTFVVITDRTQRTRQPYFGPPWKKSIGITIPSRLNTCPSFMTNCTSRSASMSSSGFVVTAMKSAASPFLIGPRSC